MSRFRLQVHNSALCTFQIWKDTWLIIPALTVEQQCTVFFAFSDCWPEIFFSSNSIVYGTPEMSFWSQDVYVVPFSTTSWPGECCRRRSLYGRQLSKRRSATYTRLKEGNALVRIIFKEWHPLLPKIVDAAPNQNIHWRICKGRQEEKQNIDVLFWWPKYWCSLLATKILMFCFAGEYYLNGHL